MSKRSSKRKSRAGRLRNKVRDAAMMSGDGVAIAADPGDHGRWHGTSCGDVAYVFWYMTVERARFKKPEDLPAETLTQLLGLTWGPNKEVSPLVLLARLGLD